METSTLDTGSPQAVLPPPDAGEGWETAWAHSWPVPAWVPLTLLLLLALLTLVLYRQERGSATTWLRAGLAALRLLVWGLALWMLYGWTQQRHRTDLPDLVVLVDDSASMATVDGDESWADRTRLGVARALLGDPQQGWLEKLAGRYRVKLFRVGRTAREVELPATGPPLDLDQWTAEEPATRLGQAVLDVLQRQRGRATAAIVLLSDGVTTEGRSLSEAAAAARRRRIPLYCVGIGGERPPADVRLGDLVMDETAFVGDLLVAEASLSAAGYADRPIRVRLVRTDGGAVLAEQTVKLPAEGSSVPVRLAYRPSAPGELSLTVVAESLPGEATLENNALQRRVVVSEETLHVLLVQAYPSYEFRYLQTLLQRQHKHLRQQERAVRLTTLLQEADPETTSLDESAIRVFPASRDELFRYDVVIFGDVDPALLGSAALEQLSAFVTQRGGGLIVGAGPRFTPLAYRGSPLEELLPVELASLQLPAAGEAIREPFRPRLSSLGRLAPPLQLADTPEQNRRLWDELPGWYWLATAPELRPGARVLVEHPSRTGPAGTPAPVLALQFVGAGKVLLQLSDDAWRWSRTPEGETAYARYWLQWIRWLSRARLTQGQTAVQISADRERYQPDDAVRLRVRFLDERQAPERDDGVTLLLQREGAGPRSLVLQREPLQRGAFQVDLEPLTPGNYRAWLALPEASGPPPSTRFTVTAPAGEQTRLALNSAELRAAAEVTAGHYYDAATAAQLLQDLPRGDQVRIETLPAEPLWNRWPAAASLVTLLVAEWFLRKRSGMM